MISERQPRFFRPDEIEDFEELEQMLAPDRFLEAMIELETLEEITGDYGIDCIMLCRNGVAWALKQMAGTLFFEEAKVVHGRFGGMLDHFWLQIGDYYLDLTLAQFKRDAPRLAITTVEDSRKFGYIPDIIYTVREWVTGELDREEEWG